jgi:hypothetical protein
MLSASLKLESSRISIEGLKTLTRKLQQTS